MNVFGQHGYGPGDKLIRGLQLGYISGAIVSAKDVSPNSAASFIAGLAAARADAEILFDPQYYAIPYSEGGRPRYLQDHGYLAQVVRNDLFYLESANIQNEIAACLQHQDALGVTHLVSPNVYIERSFDSRSAITALAFLQHASPAAQEVGTQKPVLQTLAIHRQAMTDRRELERFVQILTSVPSEIEGFYLLIGGAGSWDDLHTPDVIHNLFFLSYALKLQGYRVVLGFGDIVGSMLATIGVDASASGWYQTLRHFSMSRFGPAPGGGAPPRSLYLSTALFNRILVGELLAASAEIEDVLNELPTDASYFRDDEVIEPATKTEEALQSWDALRFLHQEFSSGTEPENFDRLEAHLQNAQALYQQLSRRGVSFETRSSGAHLGILLEGVQSFRRTL